MIPLLSFIVSEGQPAFNVEYCDPVINIKWLISYIYVW